MLYVFCLLFPDNCEKLDKGALSPKSFAHIFLHIKKT